jgi:hypothetical protein
MLIINKMRGDLNSSIFTSLGSRLSQFLKDVEGKAINVTGPLWIVIQNPEILLSVKFWKLA